MKTRRKSITSRSIWAATIQKRKPMGDLHSEAEHLQLVTEHQQSHHQIFTQQMSSTRAKRNLTLVCMTSPLSRSWIQSEFLCRSSLRSSSPLDSRLPVCPVCRQWPQLRRRVCLLWEGCPPLAARCTASPRWAVCLHLWEQLLWEWLSLRSSAMIPAVCRSTARLLSL